MKKHAAAVVWKKFPERYSDVPSDIAASVICQLESFRGECKFSTWVHEIATRKTDEALRKEIRTRAVFDTTKIVGEKPAGESEPDSDETDRARDHVCPTVRPDFDFPIAIKERCKQLSKTHAALLAYKVSGLSSNEIAAKLEISQEAVDSRWARLNRAMKKKEKN